MISRRWEQCAAPDRLAGRPGCGQVPPPRGISTAPEYHEQDQSRPVHDQAGNRRHLRCRHLHPLDRHRGRDGHPGKGRQRVRRRRRHGVYAAGRGTAFERPRRRRTDHRARYQTRPHRGDLRPGSRSPGRNHRALPQRRPGNGARHRAIGGLRARHLRILDAAAARLRHAAAARRARAGYRLRPGWLSAGGARFRHDRHGRTIVPQALDHLGRGVPAQQ